MRRFRGIARAIMLGGVLASCARLAGLADYQLGDEANESAQDRDAGGAANVADVGASEDGAATPGDGDGAEVMPSPPGTYACASGGCNGTGGACTAVGQVCQCTTDGDCKSSRCVKAMGRNDVSCGASCTGTGAADGFGCALGATSIPTACTTSFAYTPSNFAPGSYAPPATVTTIGCNTTYSSSAHAFTSLCSGVTAPTIYANVAQPGGPSVDVLAFRGLTLDSGSTLILTGSNPVILAVYGDATIAGVIDASAQGGGGGGAGATACAAGASGGGIPGPAAGAGSNPGPSGGGGGGLAVPGGAGDYSTYTNPSGNPTNGIDNVGASGGAAHGTATVVPLVGGCSGGNGADGNSGTAGGAGGVGGGGVQLAVAGTLSGSGTIRANAAAGGWGADVSPAAPRTNGGAGGGGGSGGDILIESTSTHSLVLQSIGGTGGTGGTGYGVDTTSANTWPGTPGGTGGTRSTSSTVAPAGGGPPALRGQGYTGGGGGGGGAYGWIRTNVGAAGAYTCNTTLAPVPVCNAAHAACLCVADADCSTGKCVNASHQCTGTCTGSGAADGTGCQTLVSSAAAP